MDHLPNFFDAAVYLGDSFIQPFDSANHFQRVSKTRRGLVFGRKVTHQVAQEPPYIQKAISHFSKVTRFHGMAPTLFYMAKRKSSWPMANSLIVVKYFQRKTPNAPKRAKRASVFLKWLYLWVVQINWDE